MNGIGIEQYGDEMTLKLVYVTTEPLGSATCSFQ